MGLGMLVVALSWPTLVLSHPHPSCNPLTGGAEISTDFTSDKDFFGVVEGTVEYFNVTISGIVGNVSITVSSTDMSIFETLFNETDIFEPVGGNVTVLVAIRGIFLGITALRMDITHAYRAGLVSNDVINVPDDEFVESLQFKHVVKIYRKENLLETVFTHSLLGWLIISYITMGSKMDLKEMWKKIRRPYGVLTGIACQFVIMPLIAFALAKSPGITPEAAIGLLVVGTCPGGWISNVFALLMDVDFVLSVTMTFFSSFIALGMMPLNMFLYGSLIIDQREASGLQTPYKDMALQLGLMVVPVGVGIFVTQKFEKVAKVMLKLMKPFAFGLILITLAIGIPSQLYMFKASWRTYLICFALPFCGGTLGYAFSKLLRRTNKEALTISFETGVQNSLLAVTVAKLSYPAPEADLVARMPVLVAILQASEGTLMILCYAIVRRIMIEVGQSPTPHAGDYKQCDTEFRDDQGDDYEEEDGAMKGGEIEGEIDLAVDNKDTNGYMKMTNELEVVNEQDQDNDDDVVVSVHERYSDGGFKCKNGYLKMANSDDLAFIDDDNNVDEDIDLRETIPAEAEKSNSNSNSDDNVDKKPAEKHKLTKESQLFNEHDEEIVAEKLANQQPEKIETSL